MKSYFLQLLLILILGSSAYFLSQNMGHVAKGIVGPEVQSYPVPIEFQDQLRVKKLFVSPGTMIDANMPIVELFSPALEAELQLAKSMKAVQEAHLSLVMINTQLLLSDKKINMAQNQQDRQRQKQSQELILAGEQAKLVHLSQSVEGLEKAIKSGLLAEDKLSEMGAELSMLKSRLPILKDQKHILMQKMMSLDESLLKEKELKELNYAQSLVQKEEAIIKALEDKKAMLLIKSPCPLMLSKLSLIENQVISKDQILFSYYPQQAKLRLWLMPTIEMDELERLNANTQIDISPKLGQQQRATILSITKALSPLPYPLSKDINQPEFGYPMELIDIQPQLLLTIGQVLKVTIYPISKTNP